MTLVQLALVGGCSDGCRHMWSLKHADHDSNTPYTYTDDELPWLSYLTLMIDWCTSMPTWVAFHVKQNLQLGEMLASPSRKSITHTQFDANYPSFRNLLCMQLNLQSTSSAINMYPSITWQVGESVAVRGKTL